MKRAWLLVLLAGCSFENVKYKTYPWNPYPDVETVAVFPFIVQDRDFVGLDGIEFANIFASELLKFGGFSVVRPRLLLADIQNSRDPVNLTRIDDLLRFARRHKADAVILAEITDFDPYEPPKIGLSLQLLRVEARSLSDAEVDRMVQSSSWRRGPLPMTREGAPHWIGAFERVYDAHQESVREEIIAYSQAQDDRDTPYEREREFLAVQSRFQQFVSNQVINEIIAMGLPPDEWR